MFLPLACCACFALAGNPLDVMEFSMSNATDLHYLHESMRRAMPAEADPAKVDWLQQLCTVSMHGSACV